VLALTAPLAAQVDPAKEPPPRMVQDHGYHRTTPVGDVVEILIADGLRFRSGTLEVRADSALIRVDRDAYHEWLAGRRPAPP
jgi:hypothetical protein